MPEQTPKQSSRNRKRAKLSPFRIVLIVFGLLLALLLLKIVLILTAKPTISVDYLAQLNCLLKPDDYDPNNDAAFDYQKAADLFVRMPPDLFGSSGWAFRRANLDPEELEKVNKWVIANSEALTYLKRGSAKPYLWLKVSAGDDVWCKPAIDPLHVREMGLLLSWHARIELEQARPDVALQDCIVGYKLARHFAGQKWYVQNVGRALHALMVTQIFYILTNTSLESDRLQNLQQELEQQLLKDPDPDFQGAKLFMLDTVQRICTDDGRGNGHMVASDAAKKLVRAYLQYQRPPVSQNLPRFLREYAELARHEEPSDFAVNARIVSMAMFGPDRREMVKGIEDCFEYLEKLSARTPSQLRQEGTQPAAEVSDKIGCEFLGFVCGPVHTVFIEVWQRQKVQDAALITSIAVLRYKADRGRFPEVLEDLVAAGYLKELPMDPYSDKPLVYKVLGDDFTLYSLGADFDDDSGARSSWGQGKQGGDQVFWPVEMRNIDQDVEQSAGEETRSSTKEAVPRADTSLELQEGVAVVFAKPDDARKRLMAQDAFVGSLSPFDRSVRLETDKDVSDVEFLNYVGKQVRSWHPDEKHRIRAVVQSVAKKLAPFKLKFPEKILLIKTTGEEEGGATYTRSSSIVLPEAQLDEDDGTLEQVMIHELFHILTSSDPNLQEALYNIIHFKKCNEIDLPESLRDRKITNPDAPRNDHYIEVEFDGRVVQVVPIIYSSAAGYDLKEGGDLFHYLTFRLLVVEVAKGKWRFARGGNGLPILLPVEQVPGYFDKIGRNTNYVIHPEEILADNFALLVQGSGGVESKWLIEEMRDVLERHSRKEVSKQ
jgi:hypothetical protein